MINTVNLSSLKTHENLVLDREYFSEDDQSLSICCGWYQQISIFPTQKCEITTTVPTDRKLSTKSNTRLTENMFFTVFHKIHRFHICIFPAFFSANHLPLSCLSSVCLSLLHPSIPFPPGSINYFLCSAGWQQSLETIGFMLPVICEHVVVCVLAHIVKGLRGHGGLWGQ